MKPVCRFVNVKECSADAVQITSVVGPDRSAPAATPWPISHLTTFNCCSSTLSSPPHPPTPSPRTTLKQTCSINYQGTCTLSIIQVSFAVADFAAPLQERCFWFRVRISFDQDMHSWSLHGTSVSRGSYACCPATRQIHTISILTLCL